MILLIHGPSAAGKSSLAKTLEKKGFRQLISYTTRKKRQINESGYHFIKNFREGLMIAGESFVSFDMEATGEKRLEPAKELVAKDSIYDAIYFSLKSDFTDKSMYIISKESILNIRKIFAGTSILVVWLESDPEKRKEILEKRGESERFWKDIKRYRENHVYDIKLYNDYIRNMEDIALELLEKLKDISM